MSSVGWDSDFSYSYFKKLLETIKSNFELHLLSEAPKILKSTGTQKCIIRHDIDVSPERAVEMAKIENEMGIKSTYLVMTDSPLYSIEEKSTCDSVLQLIDLGHEVGLHFDMSWAADKSRTNIELFENNVLTSSKKLKNVIGKPILSVSFHRPSESVLRGPIMVCGMVNAYAKELMTWYLSDSRGVWRMGEPINNILNKKFPLLNILVHPIWWGEVHKQRSERLQDFFEAKTRYKSKEFSKDLADYIFKAVGEKRSGLK